MYHSEEDFIERLNKHNEAWLERCFGLDIRCRDCPIKRHTNS